jgi:hypothetical protein
MQNLFYVFYLLFIYLVCYVTVYLCTFCLWLIPQDDGPWQAEICSRNIVYRVFVGLITKS